MIQSFFILILIAASSLSAAWQLIWQDEFNGASLNTASWSLYSGLHGTAEMQYYTSRTNNYAVTNGSLVITARKEVYNGQPYTSAWVETKHKRFWKYGRFEIRAKLPYGQGLWPAVWMMPETSVYGGWPASGEIDIMELLGDRPDRAKPALHWSLNGTHVSAGDTAWYTTPPGTSNFSQDFHDFAAEWTPTNIMFFYDNALVWSTNMGVPFDQPFYMILNVAVGGSWPGAPDATTVFPQHMYIDYVRVYSNTGDPAPPQVSGAPADCTTNKAFTIALDVDRNYGFWRTNTTQPYASFTTAGTNIQINRTTTLWVYGASNGISSPTNRHAYSFDTTPPRITGVPADMTTNREFAVALDVDEDHGYWSTNGTSWQQFTTNCAVITVSRTTTLRTFGRDRLGNSGPTNTSVYTFDTDAPVVTGAPANVTTNQPFTVTLGVNENYGYWSTNDGASWHLFTTNGTSMLISRTTTLRYFGRDMLGNTSESSTRTYAVGAGLPNTPAAVTASPAANSITLHWTDTAINESAFRIYRSTDNIDYMLVGNGTTNATNYSDAGLSCGRQYWYMVSATNAAGESAPSAKVSAVTVPALSVHGGRIEVLTLSNIVRISYTFDKNCIEPAGMIFKISPSGSNSFLSLGGTLRGATSFPAGGTFMNEWQPHTGFNTAARYDMLFAVQAAGFTSTPFILSNVDLSRLPAAGAGAAAVTVLNNPSRNGAPIVFSGLPANADVHVYSVSGRSIAALRSAENGMASWALSGFDGRRAAPGVYVCRITTTNDSAVIKIMVLH